MVTTFCVCECVCVAIVHLHFVTGCGAFPRSLRHVTKSIQDKPIHDEVVSETLLKLFGALLERDGADGKQSLKETRLRPKVVQTKSNDAREMHEGKVVTSATSFRSVSCCSYGCCFPYGCVKHMFLCSS